MKISDFLLPEAVCVDISASSKLGVLTELGKLLQPVCFGRSAELITEAMVEREGMGTTGIGRRIAVPHARIDIAEFRGALGISRTGVDFDSLDGKTVHFFIALLAPVGGDHQEHLLALRLVSQFFGNPELQAKLLAQKTEQGVYGIIVKEEPKD